MKKIVIASLLIATSIAAHAQTKSTDGIYAGVDLVANRYDLTLNSAINNPSNKGSTKLTGKVLLGYNFDANWAVEGGYVDLGSDSANFTYANNIGNVKAKADAWYVAAKGTVPINEQFDVYGKLGLARSHYDLSASAAGFSVSDSTRKTSLYAAVGAQYNINKNVGLTLQLEHFGKSSDLGNKGPTISTGVRYSF